MMLNSSQIRVLVQKERLVYGFLDLEKQLQPASFDLTLGKVFGFAGAGAIDFDNSQRKIPAAEEIPFGADGWVELPKGIYKLQYAEAVKVPANLAGVTFCRSSLSRCGADIYNGFWDPGYEGRGESVLVVHNERGIKLKKRAKISQIAFFELGGGGPGHLYSGMHHKENL
jgi:dUTP pyrophosphatase